MLSLKKKNYQACSFKITRTLRVYSSPKSKPAVQFKPTWWLWLFKNCNNLFPSLPHLPFPSTFLPSPPPFIPIPFPSPLSSSPYTNSPSFPSFPSFWILNCQVLNVRGEGGKGAGGEKEWMWGWGEESRRGRWFGESRRGEVEGCLASIVPLSTSVSNRQNNNSRDKLFFLNESIKFWEWVVVGKKKWRRCQWFDFQIANLDYYTY